MSDFERQYGLLGKKLGHSFSKDYFSKKFSELNLNYSYENIELENIEEILPFVKNNKKLKGFNVTIPYKETIISFLDRIDEVARDVGAVNTVKVEDDGSLSGYNTDIIGFRSLLDDVLFYSDEVRTKDALILGSGGASKAVQYVLKQNGINFKIVTRNCKTIQDIGYQEVKDIGLHSFSLIINATPVGMSPEIEKSPDLPYSTIAQHNIFIDLIYNPLETNFLKEARLKGIPASNGLKMLYGQAEAAWKIWLNK